MGGSVRAEPLIRLENFTYFWPELEVPALADVSLNIEPGDFLLCSGGNGSGKSSLALALCGIIPHKTGGRISGKVCIQGRDSRELNPSEISKSVGISFQQPQGQFFTLSLEEEVAFSLEQRGMEPSKIRERVKACLEYTGLAGMEQRSPQELSGGEMQRACLAILLAFKPKMYLLDEPLAALDPIGRKEILSLLSKIHKEGASIVVFTKSPFPWLPYVTKGLSMDNGTLSPCYSLPDKMDDYMDSIANGACNQSPLFQVGKILEGQNSMKVPLWSFLNGQNDPLREKS